MIFGVPIGEVALLAAGSVGGAVIVPVLYEVFRVLGVDDAVSMQLCVGTSLAIIVPTNIRSYLTHRANGAVDERVVKLWVGPAIGGIVIGSVPGAFRPAPAVPPA